MRSVTQAVGWIALLALVLVVLAAVGFWIWFFAPRAAADTVERYGSFRRAWRGGALTPVHSASLSAGAATVDITPPVGTPLGGYGARHGRSSTGIHDRLYAKALVLDTDTDRIAIVTCDLIGVSKSVKEQVLERVGRETQLDDAHLLICASHTHSGPGALAPELVWQMAMGRYDSRLPRELVNRLSAAIVSATSRLRPAVMGSATTTAPEFVTNRREEDPHPVVAPELTVLRIDGQDGKPIAVLVNYAAHGTCLGPDNMLVSGDWPGYLQRRLEQRLGGGAVALFANGAEGDQAPRSPTGARGYAKAQEVGFGLADRALDTWSTIETRPMLRMAAASYRVHLPEGLGSLLLTPATRIQALHLGGLVIMAVPGEMTAELGLRLKEQARRLGYPQPCIFGLANDHIGYILTEGQYRRGGYERAMSGYGAHAGPFIERALTAAVMELVARTSHPRPVAEDRYGRRICGRSWARFSAGQWGVELWGNPYQLGYRQGALLRPEVRRALGQMRVVAARERGLVGTAALLAGARRPAYILERHLSAEQVLEIYGLAQGLDLDYDTTLFLQVMLAIVEQPNLKKMLGMERGRPRPRELQLGAVGLHHCSNVAAFGPATSDGELIHGRNLDWGLGAVLPKIATVTFYHPAYGHDFVAVGWAGMIGCLTAMNDAGISVGEESVSSPGDTSLEGVPLPLLLRETIQYSGSLGDAVRAVAAAPGTCGYHVTICDGRAGDARTIEMTARHHAVRLPQDGLLFGCVAERRPEQFAEGVLPDPVIARADSTSDSRYLRLRELTRKNRGQIAPARMMAFLRDDIDPANGKPTSSGHAVCNRDTLHSVIMRPGRGDLWVAQGQMPAPKGPYIHYELSQGITRGAGTPAGPGSAPSAPVLSAPSPGSRW